MNFEEKGEFAGLCIDFLDNGVRLTLTNKWGSRDF